MNTSQSQPLIETKQSKAQQKKIKVEGSVLRSRKLSNEVVTRIYHSNITNCDDLNNDCKNLVNGIQTVVIHNKHTQAKHVDIPKHKIKLWY